MNENIVKLNYKDKEIYLVKTAHVSKNSINDVKECIGEVKPDAIRIRKKYLTNLDRRRHLREVNKG